MTHYHAAPLSGTNVDNVRFFAARHAMISFRTPDREGDIYAEGRIRHSIETGHLRGYRSIRIKGVNRV